MSLQNKALANHGNFRRLARRFHAARRGNIAMMTAFLMMPIMGLMGLAVDYGNALYVKSRLDQAAQSAASAAATTARNYVQSQVQDEDDYDQIARNTAAVSEGNYVGGKIFMAQFGALKNGTLSTPTVSVKRVANTFTATVTYGAKLNTYFTHMFGFGVPFFNLAGTRSIIIGMLDTPTPASSSMTNAVIDEKWVMDDSAVQTSYPSKPVINDWYSGTAGSASPLSRNGPGGPSSPSIQVGDPTGAIAPILSKKIYLPAGNYELRYWYKSTVVYPEYEPAYICGSVESEMHWVTSSTTRSLGSSANSATPVSGSIVSNAQTARAGVYMTPVFGNPQLDTAAPLASAFPRPPAFPYTGSNRRDNSKNRIDICTYSSKWIQRNVPIKITQTGYFWLSFVAEPPTSTTTINGFYLGPMKLCEVECKDPLTNNKEPLNINWPWSEKTTLFEDDFNPSTLDPYAVPGQAMDTRSGTFPSSAKYEQTPPWLFRAFGGLNPAYPLDQLPLFKYGTSTDSRGNVSYFANAQRTATFLFRKILLVPGVYRARFTMEMGDPTYAAGTANPTPGYYCWVGSWQRVPFCGCFVSGVDFAITHFDQISPAGLVQRELDTTIRSTVGGYYYNPAPNSDPNFTPDPYASGSLFQNCVKSPNKKTVTLCFLVPRTAFYGFNFRNAGPSINVTPGSQPFNPSDFPDVDPSDLTIGGGGARLHYLKIDVLSQGVKNSLSNDFATYSADCDAGSPPSLANVMSSGTPVWPGLAVPASVYGTPPERLTVTAPLQ